MYVWVWVKFKSFKSGVIWNDVVQPNMEAFCFSHRRFLTDGASPRVQPRQASAPLWCTDVDLGNAQRYAKFANGRPGNPKVARLWRWQWPKSLIFLLPSKRKRIEPTQCHLNSRNLPSPHRPTGEGDQVLFEKTTSWACKAVLLAHERPCSSRCGAQGGTHSTPGFHGIYSYTTADRIRSYQQQRGFAQQLRRDSLTVERDEVTKKLDKLRFYATRMVM